MRIPSLSMWCLFYGAATLPLTLCAVGLLGASPAAATQPAARRLARVWMTNYAFSPRILHIKVGTTVLWTNLDPNVGHTVTSGANSDAHAWRSSLLLFEGQHFSVTFRTPGRYPYYCMPHFFDPGMHGVVIVTR